MPAPAPAPSASSKGTPPASSTGLRPGDTVTVLGSGNMGSGIAQAAAQAGFRVVVRDLTEKDLDRGRAAVQATLDGAIQRGKSTPEKKAEVLARLTFTTDLAAALQGTRLVIEAVFEEEKVKRPLFEQVLGQVGPEVIVATNTSSLSVRQLFQGLPGQGRFAGLHFFYPAAINKLVEIIAGPETSAETLEVLTRFSYALRKIPITTSDRAGFAVNRFFVPFLNESTRILEEGLANIPTIEAAANELLGTGMGPFQLMNVTGIPIAFHSESSLERSFGRFYAPSAALKAQFEKGEKWDVKSGAVDESKRAAVQERLRGLIVGIATRLVEEEVCTPEDTDRGATVGLRWARGPFALMGEVGVARSLAAVEALHARWGDSFPVARELAQRGAAQEARWPLRQVRYRREGPVAWVLLDRPEQLNALNSGLLTDLEAAARRAADDPEVRVVLLAGSSNVFAAGADISEMSDKTSVEAHNFTLLGQRVARSLETLSKPVVAVVEGYALGGGLELALSADLILAAEGTVLGFPEVGLGIIPGFGGTQRAVRLIGRARTKLLTISAQRIKAEEAERWGLVARVYPPERLHAEARALAQQISAQAPLAVLQGRTVIDLGSDTDLLTALRLEAEAATFTFSTADQKEGMRAFLEKRSPKFQGK